MENELDNPFSVTKATEFTDSEILEYWVNFNTKENISVETILNPKEFLPKYVIGSKGCGKTHILRYFSYSVQKLRNNTIEDTLEKEKYIGFYSIISGMNSTKFKGKGIDNDQWGAVFEYYFELYICDNLLNTIREILLQLDIDRSIETKIVEAILLLFNNQQNIKNVLTFENLVDFLNELRRKIDSQVLNAAFTRKLDYEDVKILFTPGDLIFGIPNVILNYLDKFKDVKFIFIFDEYERLFEWQKKFVNTLVWDKKIPVTFWIGARRYGYTTRETKHGQEMKSGSEFQPVDLDNIIRNNEELYKQFAEKLFTNRLVKYYQLKGLNVESKEVANKFRERFEKYNESKIINEIIRKNRNKEYPHLREFRLKLSAGIKSKLALDLSNDEQIEYFVEAIKNKTEGNPLEQKYKLFFFYLLWYQAKADQTFQNIINSISTEFDKYLNKETSEFRNIIEKRKKDLIAQLTKENKIKNTEYSGVDKFIELSQGNPRSFILILKKVIEFSRIRGEKPLDEGGRIGLESQYLAVYDTARWFYEDVEVYGEEGKQMYSSLKNLRDYFIQERFCDKPVETTISCFYAKIEELSQNAISCIELMKMHSILLEDEDGRLEKNSGRKERLFQLNKTLSPLWNLPTVVRGSISLSNETAESIFNYDCRNNFPSIYETRKGQLNAPDFKKNTSQNKTADSKLDLQYELFES